MVQSNPLTGLSNPIAAIFIWLGFIVFSRHRVTSSLTAYDVMGVRFMALDLTLLLFAWAWCSRNMPVKAVIAMAIYGPIRYSCS